MVSNEGILDRIVRIVVAAVLAVSAFWLALPLFATLLVLVVAAVLMVTGIMGFCPLYKLFHINTLTGHK